MSLASDAARLYRLALEKTHTFGRYQAVAEDGVPLRAIAEVVAKGLKQPVRAMPPEEASGCDYRFGVSRAAAMLGVMQKLLLGNVLPHSVVRIVSSFQLGRELDATSANAAEPARKRSDPESRVER